jgi:hypothetical protein
MSSSDTVYKLLEVKKLRVEVNGQKHEFEVRNLLSLEI